MKRYILIILIGNLLTSCATLMNSSQSMIEVHTNPDSAIICLDDGSCYESPLCLDVPRSYSDFNIIVKNDSVEKSIQIRSKVSPEFKFGNLLLAYYCPIGYIIDASSRQKIYGYDKSILVDLSNNRYDYKKWISSKKGQFYFRGSIPWFDFIEFDNGRDGYKNYKSYMGLTVGVDYYYSPRSYLSLSGGATGISDISFPVMDRWLPDTTQYVKSFSVKLTNNHDVNVFSTDNINITLGYGLNFTHFRYKEICRDTISDRSVDLYKSNKSTLGICINANVILFKYGYIGINVLPSFYTLNSRKWESSYLAYIDFGVRLPLGYYKKKINRVVQYKPKLIE
jgi:hypothetical protein